MVGKINFVLFFLLYLFLTSCSTIQEIQKDDTKEMMLQKIEQSNKKLNETLSIIQIPVEKIFHIQEPLFCRDLDVDVNVDFRNADLETILFSLREVTTYGIFYDDLYHKKEENLSIQLGNAQEANKSNSVQKIESNENYKPANNLFEHLNLRYKGKLSNLLTLISQKTGYFFTCPEHGVIFVERQKTFSVVVPNYPELLKNIKDNLIKLGATHISYDNLTSSFTFTSNYQGYMNIKEFFEKLVNNASLVNFKIILIAVSYDTNKNIGIDWSNLVFGWKNQRMISPFDASLKYSSQNNTVNTGATESTISDSSQIFKTGLGITTNAQGATFFVEQNKFTLSGFLNFLESYGKYSILQDVYIQTLSGMKGRIEVAREVPYIKEISLSTSGTSGTTIGTATSDKAKSGVEMELLPYYDKKTKILSIDLKVGVYDVVRLVTLNAGQQIGSLTQPETTKKTVNTYLRMTPDQVVILGGLIYEKEGRETSGVIGLDTVLTKEVSKAKTKEELIILVKPSIIEFVSK